MALNFSLTAVRERLGKDKYDLITTAPHSRGTENEKWHAVSDHLIWMTMAVDLGEISESNLDEWEFRLGLLQRINGADLGMKGNPRIYITREDLENHIGLSTNVADLTRNQWLTRKIGKKDISLKSNKDRISAFQTIENAYIESTSKESA